MRRVVLAVQRLGSLPALLPAVLIAGAALAYYSSRYASELARRGEQSIVDTNRDLAEGMVARIEELIVDSDRTIFDLVDVRDLAAFPRRWSDVARFSPAVESVIILDERRRIVPDGYVSKKASKPEVDDFRTLFEREILPELKLAELRPGEHRHLHKEFQGRYYLLSYLAKAEGGRTYTVVLEGDLVYLVSEVFPRELERVDPRRIYQIADEHEQVVFGYPLGGIPARYVVSLAFQDTLYAWKLRLAPREAPTLHKRQSIRRVVDLVLIVLASATIFVGLGSLAIAVAHERKQNQMKSDFLANVSHELKTPLSLIRMFGELVATGRTRGPEQIVEYASVITRESERLTRLIDNVLDFAKIERGQGGYTFADGDLAPVVERALELTRYRLEREGIALEVAIPDDLPPVRFDEQAMTLVVLNLVDNALKYAADGKQVSVTVIHDGARVSLAVADRGPGVDPGDVGRIFERFYRGRNAAPGPVRGSGIGLALVKHVAEAHGGGVSVASTPGQGATFTVWLPVAAEPSEPGEAA